MSDIEVVPPRPSKVANILGARFRKHERLIKYFIIGGSASALDVLIFMFLYNVVGTTALLAHSVSVPTSVLYSFFTNARHNFKTTDFWGLRMTLFGVVCTIGYALGYVVIEAVAFAGFGANVGKIVSLPLVFVTQYTLNSRITFRDMTARRE